MIALLIFEPKTGVMVGGFLLMHFRLNQQDFAHFYLC
ncbi:hypothetical protein DLR74_15170 [Vibrio paracholerae]|uniref:Uncharacterized protein n=1 Tax=Vibrio cholerae TaxID=666 RepID=A0A8B5ZJV3_VIBCL|nr:hypothetical protein [Vibrio paracholerae]RBM86238.1 hypothetical protein DLR74_15170 [Vibrio paracholerae]TXY64557.1 hypothetical protein FXE81_15655 [Vibrio cholerae]TXY91854.1 hypothetical protein FXE67_07620 [Vibrio cholerae]TXZ62125.1 hypothetical protein FXE23_03770 [Vibrio cholerae]